MPRADEENRYDRMAVRLSVIISRLMAGETLNLQTLSGEFGVSQRTLRRDFYQRLAHLDIIGENGTYRISESTLRDYSPGALSFARSTGIARIIPSQSRRLMHLLMNETGTSPCFIWHDSPPSWAYADSFHRLAEAIHHHQVVCLLVGGVRHDTLEPYRLIYRHQHWYLVACQHGSLRVFRLEEIISVSPSVQTFRRRSDICSLITEESFISALPHFRFISDVLSTFKV
ncbi:transcriptional regulator [Enterobacter sp. 200527-13]|uniref:helix-turn-helix transcriptional regulator n=1 Tax=Enterobacter sp. 200527-13 TaxID=2995131 RepID=UPI0022C50E05|nr:WYL domain-containing protein [Enterobacter sp. 200527-13]GLH25584.1 transcriptional regulator [Enterobacter sp. 200527-13]